MTARPIVITALFAAVVTASPIAAAFFRPLCEQPAAGNDDAAPRSHEWIVRAAASADQASVKVATIRFLGLDIGEVVVSDEPATDHDALWCGAAR